MAGLGRKTFTRETLSSSEVQGYLMDQAVMVFPSSSARNTALPLSKVTPGMVSFLTDTDRFEVCEAAGAWKLVTASRVKNRDHSPGGANSTTDYAEITNQSIVITPRDVSEGRRLRVFIRGNFGTGSAAPLVTALIDGSYIDTAENPTQLSGHTSWWMQGDPLTAAGTYRVTTNFRSPTAGTAVSAGGVSVIYEVV